MATKIPMTEFGAKQLQKELERLKTVERPKIIEAIVEARAHGDLKENAEYHAAREQQSFIEGRISEIEAKLANAHVVNVKSVSQDGKVIFGTTVSLVNTETQESVRYQIVGDDEADLKSGKISINSPIARALIGRFAGDEVAVQTPGGLVNYDIEEVHYL